MENQVRHVPQITHYRFSAFCSRKTMDHKTAVCSHCATDVQLMHSSVRHPGVLSFGVLCGPFAKEQGSCFTISTNFKCHVISLVDVIGFNLYNWYDSRTDNHTKSCLILAILGDTIVA